MRLAVVLAFLLPLWASSQTLIRSSIFNPEDTVYMLRVWRWDWDEGLVFHAEHPFRVSTATHFDHGDYVIGYYVGDSLLHAENVHSGKRFEYIHKMILWRDLPLDSVTFRRKGFGVYLGSDLPTDMSPWIR